MIRSWTLRTTSVCFLAALLLGAGCGGPGYEYVNLAGVVKVDGKPVPKGYITFSPDGGGPVTGGAISNGEYKVKQVPLGEHKVTFTAQSGETKTIRDAANDATREVPVAIILSPKHQSGVNQTVQRGQTTVDFDLESADAAS